MAIIKQRLLRKTSVGYDTIHLETQSGLVLRPDGTDVETALGALDTAISAKQDPATTLAGYGITDAYTKSEVDTGLAAKAPTSHRATATTYGAANASYYGHVKLSDATDSTSGVSGGIAATPKALYNAVAPFRSQDDFFTMLDAASSRSSL